MFQRVCKGFQDSGLTLLQELALFCLRVFGLLINLKIQVASNSPPPTPQDGSLVRPSCFVIEIVGGRDCSTRPQSLQCAAKSHQYQGQTDQDGVWGRMAHSLRQRLSNPPRLRRNPWPSSNLPPGPCGLRRTSGVHLAFVEPSRFFFGLCLGLLYRPSSNPLALRRTSRPSSNLRPAPRPSSNFVSARWYPESSSKFPGHPALRPS